MRANAALDVTAPGDATVTNLLMGLLFSAFGLFGTVVIYGFITGAHFGAGEAFVTFFFASCLAAGPTLVWRFFFPRPDWKIWTDGPMVLWGRAPRDRRKLSLDAIQKVLVVRGDANQIYLELEDGGRVALPRVGGDEMYEQIGRWFERRGTVVEWN